jgi:hypothetical protein
MSQIQTMYQEQPPNLLTFVHLSARSGDEVRHLFGVLTEQDSWSRWLVERYGISHSPSWSRVLTGQIDPKGAPVKVAAFLERGPAGKVLELAVGEIAPKPYWLRRRDLGLP